MKVTIASVTRSHIVKGAVAFLFGLLVAYFAITTPSVYGELQLPTPPSPQDIINPTVDAVCDTENHVSDVTGISFPTPDCDGGGSSSSSSSGGSSSSSSSSSSGGSSSSSSGGSSSSSSSGGSSSSSSSSSGGSSSSSSSGGSSSSSSSGGSSSSGSSSSSSGGGRTYRVPTTSAPTSVAAVGQCEQYLFGFIRPNEVNDAGEVEKLQRFLRDEEGYDVAVTGVYDAPTIVAVRDFQREYATDILGPWGIGQDTGYVYLTTRKKITELHCENAKQFTLTAEQLAEISAAQGVIVEAAASGEEAPSTIQIGSVDTETNLAEGDDTDSGSAVLVEETTGSGRNTASVAESSLGKFFRGVGGFFGRMFDRVF